MRGPCPRCTATRQRTHDERRATSSQRGYGSHWRRVVRLPYLQEHPLCVLCGALAEVPDHYPRTRRELLAAGVEDVDADEHLRPLCLSCHARHGRR